MVKEKMKNLKEKGKEFVEKHKIAIGMIAGAGAAICGNLVAEKIFEPKYGSNAIEKSEDGNIKISNYYLDRFDHEHNPFNTIYSPGTEPYDYIVSAMSNVINSENKD